MKYLKRFLTILTDYFPNRAKISNEINEQEILTRYITQTRWYSSQKNIVKPQAFMPPPNLRLSVFRVFNLPEPRIWEIGIAQVINKMREQKSLHGRADIQALSIMGTGLKVDPDNTPPRHASIIGWPEQKEKQKSIAQELAAKASLKLKT